MDISNCLDFFNATGDADAFEVHTTSKEHTKIVSDLEQHVTEGRLVAVREAFGALRSTGKDRRWLERPGSAPYLAVIHLHVGIADYLLSEGVKKPSTHVRCAIEKNNEAIIGLFIDHAWDINQQSIMRCTASTCVSDKIYTS